MAGVLIAAACLRPAITSVGPLLDQISNETGMRPGMLGLLGALPLLMFGIVSPFVHKMARRFGTERLLASALALLAVGTALRSVPGDALLWLGTVVIGSCIAVGNVIVPSIVKRDFGSRMSLVTSLYTAVMGGMAALASGLAVPIASATGSWRWALACWLVLAVTGFVIWYLRPNSDTDPDDVSASATGGSPWRTPTGWYVSIFMGLQSAVFYLMVTWLPTYEADHGTDAATAGWHLFAYQLTGMLCGFTIGIVLDRSRQQSGWALLVTVWTTVAIIGMVLFPEIMLVWSIFGGVASGTSLVVALSLIGLRSRTHTSTVRLSGMAQCIGYFIAAAATMGAGAVVDLVGSRTVLIGMIAMTGVQTVFGFLAGRDRYVDDQISARPRGQ